jgi:hypothetical protein
MNGTQQTTPEDAKIALAEAWTRAESYIKDARRSAHVVSRLLKEVEWREYRFREYGDAGLAEHRTRSTKALNDLLNVVEIE